MLWFHVTHHGSNSKMGLERVLNTAMIAEWLEDSAFPVKNIFFKEIFVTCIFISYSFKLDSLAFAKDLFSWKLWRIIKLPFWVRVSLLLTCNKDHGTYITARHGITKTMTVTNESILEIYCILEIRELKIVYKSH